MEPPPENFPFTAFHGAIGRCRDTGAGRALPPLRMGFGGLRQFERSASETDFEGLRRARAERVRRSLGAESWELDRISIESGGIVVPRRAGMAYAAAESGTPPAARAGTSKVSITVSGSIVLE